MQLIVNKKRKFAGEQGLLDLQYMLHIGLGNTRNILFGIVTGWK